MDQAGKTRRQEDNNDRGVKCQRRVRGKFSHAWPHRGLRCGKYHEDHRRDQTEESLCHNAEMEEAHSWQLRQTQQPEIFQVTVKPAIIAIDEFYQGWRNPFVTAALHGQYTNLVASALHERCFDLIVANDVPAER